METTLGKYRKPTKEEAIRLKITEDCYIRSFGPGSEVKSRDGTEYVIGPGGNLLRKTEKTISKRQARHILRKERQGHA